MEQAWGGFGTIARLPQVPTATQVLVVAAWDGTVCLFCSLEIV